MICIINKNHNISDKHAILEKNVANPSPSENTTFPPNFPDYDWMTHGGKPSIAFRITDCNYSKRHILTIVCSNIPAIVKYRKIRHGFEFVSSTLIDFERLADISGLLSATVSTCSVTGRFWQTI